MKVISKDKRHIYDVTSSSCNCPDFVFRRAARGEQCKHMEKYFDKKDIDIESNDIDELSKIFKDGLNFDIAYKKLGEEKIKQLIEVGVICKSPKKGDYRFILLE